MRNFLDVWQQQQALAGPELIPVLRRFTLACLDVCLRKQGVPDSKLVEIRQRALGKYLVDEDTARYYEETPMVPLGTDDLWVYLKAYENERFHPFERALVHIPQNNWKAALRVTLTRAEAGTYRIGGVYVGLLRWTSDRKDDETLEPYRQAVIDAWRQEGAEPRQLAPECGERWMLGSVWQAGEWRGTEAELVERIGALWAAVPITLGPEEETEMGLAAALADRLHRRGYRYSEEQIATFYGALKAKGFVILSGLSGTGKTKLAQEFAAALGLDDDHFLLEPVKPEWRDATGLLGYWNPVSRTYEAPRFLRRILEAANEYQAALSGAAAPAQTRDRFSDALHDQLRGERWVQDWLQRYRGALARFHQRTGPWTDEELDLLWRIEDERQPLTPIRQAPKPVVSNDVLGAVMDILADRQRTIAQRASAALTYLQQAGEPRRQWARIMRALAVLEPQLVPAVVRVTDLLAACSVLGVSVPVHTGDNRLWDDLEVLWPKLQAALTPLLAAMGEPTDDPGLRGVVTWLLATYAGSYAALQVAEAGSDGARPETVEAGPHLLVLDEMNLARVEYYLADLLSVLETGRDADGLTRGAISLHSQPEPIELDDGLTVPPELRLPPNLYIVGTVNMDETTFAFSPKVLDRAFTLEFRKVDLSEYPPASAPDPGGDDDLDVALLLADFTRQGRFARFDKQDVATWAAGRRQLIQALDELNGELEDHDLGFGYRVVDEILAFVGGVAESPVAGALPEADAFDAAVLMKVLPKFHGPLHRMQAPLEAVMRWAGPEASPRYRRTYAKAERMLRRARDLGHCSFS